MKLSSLVLIPVVLVAAGCGGTGRSAVAGSIWQRTFLSTAVAEGGTARTLVAGTRIRLAFEHGRVRADAGCNQFAGSATTNGDRLVVTGLGGTDMACDPARQAQDTWLSTFLSASPTWQLDGDTLVLRTRQAEMRLTDRRVADPDRPLRGTRWILQSIIDGQRVDAVPAGIQAYVTLDDADRVSGSTGCNTFDGSATGAGDRITFGVRITTTRMCTPEAGRVEHALVTVLAGQVAVQVEADHLTITHPGGQGLGFVAGH